MRFVSGLLLLGSAHVAPAQGIGHSFFMRGSIVGLESGQGVICIGKADGAEPAQLLEVYRIEPIPGPPRTAAPAFRRKLVGHVRVEQIVDDHFARISVVNGAPRLHDIAETKRVKR
ncbi:hypothetical protein HJG53_12640 [Sphingomonas sp. ID1715]|nr:hypothetical protein [Sphingomonas sp. ID1715]